MPGISTRLIAAVTLAACCAATSALQAQVRALAAANLVGLVRDSSGSPIGGVEVWIRGTDLYTHTNDSGGFRLMGAPGGPTKVALRRMGFEQALVDLQLRLGRTDSLVVSMTSVAATLPGVLVEDEATTRSKRLLAGFWERRSRGFGHFFTRDEIEARNAHEFTDIVRTTPGVSVVMVNGRRSIRFSRSGFTGRGDCPPQYVVDGMRLENATPDEFPPQDIEALEIYNGISTIPAQFAPRVLQQQRTCGAIVIWTRLPGT